MDRQEKYSYIYDYQLRLQKAVNKEDVQSITDLLEEADINDDADKHLFLKYRLDACSKAIAIKNLELVKLLFPSDDIFHNGKLDEKMNMDLVDACITADFKEGVQYLLSSGLVLDLPNKKWSALEKSVKYSKLEVLGYLLSLDGINLNPNQEKTLLMTACEIRNPHLIQMLLETNVRYTINARSKIYKETALHYCLEEDYYGHDNNLLECVQLLIKSGADPNLKTNNETPVEIAMRGGMIPTVTYLVINGAKVDVRNNNNDSLLHILIRNARAYHDHDDAEYGNCIQALVNAGIDLNQTNINGETPIYLAVANGSINFVKSLIQMNCDVNTSRKESALSLSISRKRTDIAELLIRAGCDVNAAYKYGITPLMQAVEKCVPDIVKLLLEHGANIHVISKNKQTPLDFIFERSYYDQASEAGYIEILRLLLDAGYDIHQSPSCLFKAVDLGYINLAKVLVEECANVDFTKECSGENTLMLATQRSYTEIVAILVEKVTDINHKDHKGNTALLKAVIPRSSSKSNEIVDILLDYGADPWVRNKKLQTPLMLAANNTVFVNFDELLVNETYVNLQDEEGNTALMYAIINDRQRLMENLLRHSADANLQNNRGETSLMKAVKKNRVEMVKSLVLNGANVNLQDRDGKTALMFAVKEKNSEIWAVLLKEETNVNVNLQDEEGNTALMYAVINDRQPLIEDLLRHSAEANLQNNRGETALMKAVRKDQVQTVKSLVLNGSNVNLQDRDGKTALMFAVEEKNNDILAVRLKEEANVNHQDNAGKTALMSTTNASILNLLLQSKANVSLRDNRGRTALMYFSERNIADMVITLLNTDGNTVNTQEESGKTALMLAIEANQVDKVRLLLQHGADPNLCDNNGKIPLIAAALFLNREMVQMLLDSKADINLKDNDGYSIFQHVSISTQNRKWVNILKLLLMRGGSICLDKRMKNGKTLLQCTLERKEADISWYLIIENCRLEDLNASDVIETFKCSDIFEVCKSLYLSGLRKDQTEMIFMLTTMRSKVGVLEDGEEPSSNIDKFREFCQSMDLKSHCRRKIRECIGAGIQQKITKLGLPTSLQDFVLLKDVIPENHFTLTVDDKDDDAMLPSVMYSGDFNPFGLVTYDKEDKYYDDDNSDPYDNDDDNYSVPYDYDDDNYSVPYDYDDDDYSNRYDYADDDYSDPFDLDY